MCRRRLAGRRSAPWPSFSRPCGPPQPRPGLGSGTAAAWPGAPCGTAERSTAWGPCRAGPAPAAGGSRGYSAALGSLLAAVRAPVPSPHLVSAATRLLARLLHCLEARKLASAAAAALVHLASHASQALWRCAGKVQGSLKANMHLWRLPRPARLLACLALRQAQLSSSSRLACCTGPKGLSGQPMLLLGALTMLVALVACFSICCTADSRQRPAASMLHQSSRLTAGAEMGVLLCRASGVSQPTSAPQADAGHRPQLQVAMQQPGLIIRAAPADQASRLCCATRKYACLSKQGVPACQHTSSDAHCSSPLHEAALP